jgi:fatty acid desaturase
MSDVGREPQKHPVEMPVAAEPLEEMPWFKTLSSEKRNRIRELHRIQPARNLVVLLFLGLWCAAAAGVHLLPVWPVRIAGYLVIGTAIHSLAILMHEGSHGNLFRRRWMDRSFGFLCGAPALLSYSAYRVTHLEHHRHLRGERDPEEFANIGHGKSAQALAFYVWGVFGALSYVILVPVTGWSRGNRQDRLDILTEYVLLALLYASLLVAAVRFGFAWSVLHCLVLPWLVTIAFTNVRGWAEHAMTLPGHPLTQTRVVTSNWLVSLLMCNTNYHLEHHLYPGMPWYNLRKLHRLLSEEYRRAGSFLYTSYFRFLWDGARAGVHGLAPRVPGH